MYLGDELLVGLPVIHAEAQHVTAAQLLEQPTARLISAPPDNPCYDLAEARLEGVPEPSLVYRVTDK
jgi:hypothetical protein